MSIVAWTEAVEQLDTANETVTKQVAGWELSGAALQSVLEVEAAMGGHATAMAHPAAADYLYEHFTHERKLRAERCEEKRLDREDRWREIASGERQPLSLDLIDTSLGPRPKRRKKAA